MGRLSCFSGILLGGGIAGLERGKAGQLFYKLSLEKRKRKEKRNDSRALKLPTSSPYA